MDIIVYEDFAKCDIRVGTIMSAVPVPKSNKLLQLEVDFGEEIGKRIILGGIASILPYHEFGIVGMQVTAVVNLAPRQMMGLLSEGMILAYENDGKLFLVTCPKAANGTKIG